MAGAESAPFLDLRSLETLAPTSAGSRSVRARTRIVSVDVLRGIVVILMALDHVRDYVTGLRVQPENLAHGSVALFATRWVTHFCAPVFALLAGVGIGLAMDRGKSAAEMSRFLLVRGVWLLVLDVVITPVAWQFGFRLVSAFALVLWALGLSMILMAALIHLPRPLVAAGSLLLVGTHNLLDGISPGSWGVFAPLRCGTYCTFLASPFQASSSSAIRWFRGWRSWPSAGCWPVSIGGSRRGAAVRSSGPAWLPRACSLPSGWSTDTAIRFPGRRRRAGR